ncbi:AAA family ATPase [Clostridium botulinum]|uniref:AAA domain-containing protein n=1 Tax=Clostridium botulinum TaxID=1491 RepID=A0A6B4JHE6_CLOBO|nr:AAA family ATPase [Clostridium botulinum]EES51144.1 Soj protein [Clostridium botulinum E1 str. 'BoNT E Beluga']MBY6759703.1 AAA family ATPase [Clostridium botulinum]MBY6918611.1 AAA family ATPase [Clostridium botulinum]MCR1129694.1 AAA family ATPase [Clostridium botulinum]NFJ56426.1 hypothetical protein [Clostridium botulinum]
MLNKTMCLLSLSLLFTTSTVNTKPTFVAEQSIEKINLKEMVQTNSEYVDLDLIPANMHLLKANLDVIMDVGRPQQYRLRKALKQIEEEYDYCIIDNPPDINISVINALVSSNDVLIPKLVRI